MPKRKNINPPKNKKGKRFKVDNIENPPNFDSSQPIFSFKYMKYGSKSCISGCENDIKSHIIDSLLRLSQRTWEQIKGLPRKTGFEKISIERFKVPFPPTITPEVPILVMRYDDNGGRLAGFRENDVYHIVLAGKKLYPH